MLLQNGAACGAKLAGVFHLQPERGTRLPLLTARRSPSTIAVSQLSARREARRGDVGERRLAKGEDLRRQNLDLSETCIVGPPISLIVTDVDGTLLDSNQELSERNVNALKTAMEQGIQVILATGKARGPWVQPVVDALQLTTPGVFLQGLLIYNADGSIRYERTMEESLAREVIGIAVRERITLTAYCGERILCEATDGHTDRLIGYGEPPPEAVGPLDDIVGKITIHKLIFMAEDSRLSLLRPGLERLLSGRASVVTALDGMLEVLPLGASKGRALSMLLQDLNIPFENVMAIGDGENDIEMLESAGLAVAMGNASPQVKSAATFVTGSNDYDGLAQAVERFVLAPGFWCWD